MEKEKRIKIMANNSYCKQHLSINDVLSEEKNKGFIEKRGYRTFNTYRQKDERMDLYH